MKKLLLLHLLLAMFLGAQTAGASVVLNATNFPDANFRAYISNLTGVNVGSTISDAKLANVTNIDVNHRSISSLQGIEYFTELTKLDCSNNQLTSLDVRWNTKLIDLNCNYNQLTSLDFGRNTKLEKLRCLDNNLTSLSVSNNICLTVLYCLENQLTSLDVTKNTELIYLNCETNHLTSLDVSKNTELTSLDCSSNQLTSLDVTKNTKLTKLHCVGNQLTSLDVSKNTELTELYCHNNQLSSLDVSKNTLLKELSCHGNKISYLYLSKNTELEVLVCSSNKIDQLNLSNNTKLTELKCNDNYLTNLNLDNNTALTNSDIVSVGSHSSTRRFTVNSYGSDTNNCWTLYVGTTDASRIRALKIDGVSKTPKVTASGWLVVSEDLKKIPQKVEYEIYTGNEVAGWMPVTVNYDVKRYGVYIDGTELTSLNFYDIPGLKEGTAYFYDESYDLGWSGIYPTLVLYDAKIEGEKGLYNKECYDLKIIARGNNSITATDWTGFDTDAVVKTTISGGGKLWITATGDRNGGIYNSDASTLKITDGTKVISQGDGYGFFDDGGTLYIQDNSILACYGNESASVELPVESKCKFDSNIGIRYPVGAYIGNSYHVFYAGTTTDVQQDWVVIGPDNQATQDFIIATGIQDLKDSKDSKDLKVYNLAGQRLSKTQRGINIVGGRKVVIK
ncbi:MAG: leucine-rich repeat domain-containing protein [Bacteroidaceae bacterium]|nr:leucine-rich repeat domain-containing protein [Bacteroidaceae bacterium]